ncbi:hypothetical protein EMIHUDRAFT_222184 [Emiliania huxleyi CCMP1516]|uniref:Secreted protein n=2 Tax=Emiliania huxleyi TaxID=2903 RepID=A0A0D3KYK1_EMIH1|nr:hypothetical protein EMIHUDRAFT_222184 [Emiliania huxleyi CCMP1516]EOD40836.1 hypothetical protein EMIHUDRAFT_222184 [Emiliania huxleyi CCMP1516]|eukprot:XP_005793265.1 hypothetical protein EMIHUDRAFT_222184 [Emiliania huxleyi CCMP1516]
MRRVALASAALAFSVCPPNGWEVPLLLWHASRLPCDWPAPRRVSSARCSDSGQRNSSRLDSTLSHGAPARAGARHGACNASECSPRLTQMRPSSQPTVHRLLKEHTATNAAPATHGRLVMTQL